MLHNTGRRNEFVGLNLKKTFVDVGNKIINTPDFVNITMIGQVTARNKEV